MAGKENVLIAVFLAVFLFSLIMINFQHSQITGFATTGTTISNVTISYYLSISMSTNLTNGILFGSVSSLPATDINATHNYDDGGSASSMFLNVSTDSNVNVDFCIKANTDLTDSANGNIIGLGNETYNNATTTNASLPFPSTQTLLTTSYAKAGQNVTKGSFIYYRAWLDIPASQPAGDYNNSISFEGVRFGQGC
jgi:hypothetical protein